GGPARRRPRLSVPVEVRRPFAVAAVAVLLAWSVNSLYAALGPSLAADILGDRNHVVGGLTIFLFYATAGAGQAGLRAWSTRRAMAVGAVLLALGMALVAAALATGSLLAFLGGTLVAGLGSGLCFLSGLTLVNQTAPAHQRSEVVSAYNVVGYVALSLPVIGIGLLTGVIGLLTTTIVFTAAVVVLAAVTLAAAARALG
ncbi:MAG: MFS transporter, partial [Acidimicrobiales bacterium]